MMEMEMNAGLDEDNGSSSSASSKRSSTASFLGELQQDFSRITEEMKNNPALAEFEAEYTRLYELLYSMNKSQREAGDRCKELKDQVTNNQEQIVELEAEANERQERIQLLEVKLENAEKLADAASGRELNAQQVIENLRISVAKLTDDIDQKNKQLSVFERGGESKQKEGLMKERERLTSEMNSLKQSIKNMSQYTDELERRIHAGDLRITEMQEQLDVQQSVISKEGRVKERMEAELHRHREDLKIRDVEAQNFQMTIKSLESQITKLDSSAKELKLNLDSTAKEYSKLAATKSGMQKNVVASAAEMDRLFKELEDRDKENRDLMHQLIRARGDVSRARTEKDITEKKVAKVDRQRYKCEEEMGDCRVNCRNLESAVTTLKRQLQYERSSKDQVTRDKEQLVKSQTLMQETIRKNNSELQIYHLTRNRLENEINDVFTELEDTKKLLTATEKERDRYSYEAQKINEKLEDCTDDGRLKDLTVNEMKMKLEEMEARMRQQNNSLQAARAEGNQCSKGLIEATEEIDELKKKLKLTDHQVKQLNEDIATKEKDLVKKEFMLGKADKEKDLLKGELSAARKAIADLRQGMEELRMEERRLREQLNKADMEISCRRKDMEAMSNERDVHGTQLVRRNDEVGLQYNRMNLMDLNINSGEMQYRQRVEDIRLLKLEVARLTRENGLLSRSIANTLDYRKQLGRVSEELTKERLKVTALEEQVQNPLNVHRWRKLQGTDPDKFELIKKIQMLQRRTIGLTAALTLKEKKVRDVESMYEELKVFTSKQPALLGGPIMSELLNRSQDELRKRGQKMKCITSELYMREVELKECKYRMDKMSEELCKLRCRSVVNFGKGASGELLHRDADKVLQPTTMGNGKKIAGGGFNFTAACQATAATTSCT